MRRCARLGLPLLGKRGYIPVAGFLNKIAVKATLVPIGNGRHRFFVNGDMMKRAGNGADS